MMMNQQGSWVLIVAPTSLRLTKRHLGSAGKWKIFPVEIETRSLLKEMEMVDKQNPCIPAEEAIATDRMAVLMGKRLGYWVASTLESMAKRAAWKEGN